MRGVWEVCSSVWGVYEVCSSVYCVLCISHVPFVPFISSCPPPPHTPMPLNTPLSPHRVAMGTTLPLQGGTRESSDSCAESPPVAPPPLPPPRPATRLERSARPRWPPGWARACSA